MRVMQQVLSPRMQHAEEADLGAEMPGIGCNLEQRGGAGAKQKVVENLLVVKRQRRQKMRKREDHVDIRHGQEFRIACGEPLVTGVGLTLGTVTITACNGELSITCLMG